MSFDAFQWAKAQSCTGPAKTVLLLLAEAANHHPEKGHAGQIVWLSRATLAAWGGISERTVKRAFRTLEDLGLIVNLGCNQPGTEATVYRVNVGATASAPDEQRPTQPGPPSQTAATPPEELHHADRPWHDASPATRPNPSPPAPPASDAGPRPRRLESWTNVRPVTGQPNHHEQRLPLRAASGR